MGRSRRMGLGRGHSDACSMREYRKLVNKKVMSVKREQCKINERPERGFF